MGYDLRMDKIKRPVGRPPSIPTDEQYNKFMDAMQNCCSILKARKRSGITQRQLERIRKVEQIDFRIRLNLKHHRHMNLSGGDAALHLVLAQEAEKLPWEWRDWPEIEAELKRLRAVHSGTPLWHNPEEPSPIPPDPEGIF